MAVLGAAVTMYGVCLGHNWSCRQAQAAMPTVLAAAWNRFCLARLTHAGLTAARSTALCPPRCWCSSNCVSSPAASGAGRLRVGGCPALIYIFSKSRRSVTRLAGSASLCC